MSPTISKALLIGAALFLTIALIGIAVNLFGPAADASKAAQTDFANTTTELKDQKYLIYDNTVVSGSQVVNALRKFQREGEQSVLGIYVETGKNQPSAGTWYYNEFTGTNLIDSPNDSLAPTKDVKSNDFINPSGMFDATVIRDGNGVIRAIKFIQQ